MKKPVLTIRDPRFWEAGGFHADRQTKRFDAADLEMRFEHAMAGLSMQDDMPGFARLCEEYLNLDEPQDACSHCAMARVISLHPDYHLTHLNLLEARYRAA